MNLSFRVIQNPQEFRDLEHGWNNLLERSDSNIIYLTWEWISTWWECFGDEYNLWLVCASLPETNLLMGIAPLCYKTVFKRGIPLVYLSLIENEITAADHLDFIVDRSEKESITKILIDYIFNNSNIWDVIQFKSLSSDSEVYKIIKRLYGGKILTMFEQEVCPYILLPDNYEKFYNSLSNNKRKNIRKNYNKWNNLSNKEILQISDEKQLEPALDNLYNFNISVNAVKGKSSTFLNPKMRKFHKLVSRKFLSNGWLRILQLVTDGIVIAIEYSFNYNNITYSYSGGYNNDWSMIRPGHIMMEFSIKFAIAENSKIFDLLRGTENYKYTWTKTNRIDYDITIPVSFKGKILYYLGLLLKKTKKWLG